MAGIFPLPVVIARTQTLSAGAATVAKSGIAPIERTIPACGVPVAPWHTAQLAV